MKTISYFFNTLVAATLVMTVVGCASAAKERQDMAIAAGFRVITPKTPEQAEKLALLPKDKVSEVHYEGKDYYVLPDAEHHQAYVGGPQQYQAYHQIRLQKEMVEDQVAAAQMNQMAAMNWGMWNGWGGWGRRGWY